MIRKLISKFFPKKEKIIIVNDEVIDIDNSDVIPLKSSSEFRKQHRHNYYKDTEAFYDKIKKELILKITASHTTNYPFPFEIGGEWKFRPDSKDNTYIIDTCPRTIYKNLFVPEILEIQMKEIGINGSIKIDNNLCIFKLSSDEDYAMFSLYFNEYINFIPENSGIMFRGSPILTGGGGSGGVGVVSYSNSNNYNSYSGAGGAGGPGSISYFSGGGGGTSCP
jgi:hypothetical protein